MKIKIKRIDKSLPLPEYHSSGAVAFDVYARVETKIEPQTVGKIPTNIIVETPKGYVLFIKDRGSTMGKKGLIAHSGFVDQDFCGPEDEIMYQVFNFTNERVVVEKGERIGQAAFIPIEIVEWKEVENMEHNKTRGGFGSTGGYKDK
jgi:dUTP pyrophosphatase